MINNHQGELFGFGFDHKSKSKSKRSHGVDNAEGAGFIPDDARAGECYAQVIIPAKYESVTERVLVKEASTRIEITPAEFEETEMKVMVKAPSKKLEVVPATYKTIKDKVVVNPASERIVQVPVEYGYEEEKVLVSPARTVWQKGGNPLSQIDGKTGEIVCLVNLPAEYKTVKKQVVKAPATTRVEKIPATYELVDKVVEATPATTKEIIIPAEYAMRTVKKIIKPEQKKIIPVPAEYKTITRQVKVSPSKTDWRRVLCETNVTPEIIFKIQKALDAKGFNPGPMDGVYGNSTKMALENFQSKNNLPRGSLNYETIQALGVEI